MERHDLEAATDEVTIRTVGWASRMRMGVREGGSDEGVCADLDQASGKGAEPSTTRVATSRGFGLAPNVAREVLAVVRAMLPRAEATDARIRVEIDPMAATLPGEPVATILYGMLKRAIDARGDAIAQSDPTADAEEITLCVRRDGGLLRIHVLDSVADPSGSSGGAAIGLASATAQSLGGSLERSSVPFGAGTLLSAAIPICRLGHTAEDAA